MFADGDNDRNEQIRVVVEDVPGIARAVFIQDVARNNPIHR